MQLLFVSRASDHLVSDLQIVVLPPSVSVGPGKSQSIFRLFCSSPKLLGTVWSDFPKLQPVWLLGLQAETPSGEHTNQQKYMGLQGCDSMRHPKVNSRNHTENETSD